MTGVEWSILGLIVSCIILMSLICIAASMLSSDLSQREERHE